MYMDNFTLFMNDIFKGYLFSFEQGLGIYCYSFFLLFQFIYKETNFAFYCLPMKNESNFFNLKKKYIYIKDIFKSAPEVSLG